MTERQPIAELARTSRLQSKPEAINLKRINAGFPATVIEVGQRLDYYQALDHAHCSSDYTDFIRLVANAVEKSVEPYWWALGIEAEMARYLEELGYGSFGRATAAETEE
jgi:hypothetical protein